MAGNILHKLPDALRAAVFLRGVNGGDYSRANYAASASFPMASTCARLSRRTRLPGRGSSVPPNPGEELRGAPSGTCFPPVVPVTLTQ